MACSFNRNFPIICSSKLFIPSRDSHLHLDYHHHHHHSKTVHKQEHTRLGMKRWDIVLLVHWALEIRIAGSFVACRGLSLVHCLHSSPDCIVGSTWSEHRTVMDIQSRLELIHLCLKRNEVRRYWRETLGFTLHCFTLLWCFLSLTFLFHSFLSVWVEDDIQLLPRRQDTLHLNMIIDCLRSRLTS